MDIAEAKAEIIPGGQNAGRTIGDIAATPEGVSFLRWHRAKITAVSRTGNAIQAVLDDIDAQAIAAKTKAPAS